MYTLLERRKEEIHCRTSIVYTLLERGMEEIHCFITLVHSVYTLLERRKEEIHCSKFSVKTVKRGKEGYTRTVEYSQKIVYNAMIIL